MIHLTKNVPSVYSDESRDFQFLLHLYSAVFSTIKQDIDGLNYLTDTEQCNGKLLQLLKSKLGFFTDYSMPDNMLREILRGFPYIVKRKGSLESIQEALNIFLRVLNIKTEIVLKATTEESESMYGDLSIGDHTIVIAIHSAFKNIYILEELFRYIMPAGYQYLFYFFKDVKKETWLFNKNTGRYLIVNTLVADSIYSPNMFNEEFNEYADPYASSLLNQLGTINLYSQAYNPVATANNFAMRLLTWEPDNFTSQYYFYYKIEDGKFVQLKQSESYVEETYYIPQFIFTNNIFDSLGESVYERLKEEYDENDPSDKIFLDYFKNCYFNFYIRENNSNPYTYKNLQEPVNIEDYRQGTKIKLPNIYYQIKEGTKIRAVSNGIESYIGIPYNNEYINVISIMTEQPTGE